MSENQKRLHREIAERITREGPITVAEYMSLAVETYYATKNPFGANGDFITAPDISQMFGEMIGAWVVDVWMQMGRPEKIQLIELGPGRGTLSADIMRTVSTWPDFKSAVELHLVENSPQLRDVQRETLKDYKVQWHTQFADVPAGACLVIANEFFDALPIQQFEKVNGEWRERKIEYDPVKDIFIFSSMVNEVMERSPASVAVIVDIAKRIEAHGGAALVIDYGYMMPSSGDTLQAVSKHAYANPLEEPGEKDITAHVDFGALKAAAENHAAVAGPVTQGQFLITMGIEARAHKLWEKANSMQRKGIMTDLCRLVAPQEMGRLFKVMALTPKEAMMNPAGFGMAHNDEISDDGS